MTKPDYMNWDEYNDLEAMKEKVIERKLRFFDYAKYLNTMTAEDRQNSGYSKFTNAEAIQKCLKDAINEIEKMIRLHEKKYPD